MAEFEELLSKDKKSASRIKNEIETKRRVDEEIMDDLVNLSPYNNPKTHYDLATLIKSYIPGKKDEDVSKDIFAAFFEYNLAEEYAVKKKDNNISMLSDLERGNLCVEHKVDGDGKPSKQYGGIAYRFYLKALKTVLKIWEKKKPMTPIYANAESAVEQIRNESQKLYKAVILDDSRFIAPDTPELRITVKGKYKSKIKSRVYLNGVDDNNISYKVSVSKNTIETVGDVIKGDKLKVEGIIKKSDSGNHLLGKLLKNPNHVVYVACAEVYIPM